MNDTLSTPDPATQVAEVRHIIEGRTFLHSCEATLLAIRRVVIPDLPSGEPPAVNERGWVELSPNDDIPPGTAWERHDDPEV